MPKQADSERSLRTPLDGPVVPQGVAETEHIRTRRSQPAAAGAVSTEAPQDRVEVIRAAEVTKGDVIDVDGVLREVTSTSHKDGQVKITSADANGDKDTVTLDDEAEVRVVRTDG
jgi:hypothetical protein